MKTAIAVLVATFSLPAFAHDAAMRAVMECRWGDGLRVTEVAERAPGADSRVVQTKNGERTISVVDGVRIILSPPGAGPFVNLKVEQSAPGHLDDDRDAVLQQAALLHEQGKGKVTFVFDEMNFQEAGPRGVSVLAMERADLGGGVVGMLTLTARHSNLMVTAYLLDQGPTKRGYDDYAGYKKMRDAFVASLTACMAP